MLKQDGVQNVQRMYDRAKQAADNAKACGDLKAWAIFSVEATAIDTTAVMLDVFIDNGTGH